MKLKLALRCLTSVCLLLGIFSAQLLADEVAYSLDETAAIISFHLQSLKKPVPVDLKDRIFDYWQQPKDKPFTFTQVEQMKNDAAVFLEARKPQPNPLPSPDQKAATPQKKVMLWGLKIRQDANDVVQDEDPSVEDPKIKRNQVAGAAFSFSRNFISDVDTWSAKGALIRPFRIFNNDEGFSASDGPTLRAVYLIPSISLHKVDTNGKPTNKVDSLIYRLGASARWNLVRESFISEFELRGFGVHATDTDHKASAWVGEFDVEPRLAGQDQNARWALGFKASLVPHTPDKDHPIDTSELLYSLRFFGHGESGNVEDSGGDPAVRTGRFFRFGPTARLEVQPCIIARSLGMDPQGLTLHVSYAYLPTLSGINPGHDSLFRTGLDWAILKRKDGEQKVSLKLLYEDGGLEITKKPVETFTAGLGITF